MNVNTPIWDWLDYAVVYGLRFLFVLMFILFIGALIATLYDYKPRRPNKRRKGVLPAPASQCVVRDPWKSRFLQ